MSENPASAKPKRRSTLVKDIPRIPPPQSLSSYVPRDDGSHLLLGSSGSTQLKFLHIAGLLEVNKEWSEAWGRTCYKYSESYERDASTVKWLDAVKGPLIKGGSLGLQNVTGYDICEFVKRWMERNEYAHLSVCEVILCDDRFSELRGGVGLANVFLSHVLQEDLLLNFGDLNSFTTHGFMETAQKQLGHRLPERSKRRWWMDIFSLRQCKIDFVPDQIRGLIKQIPHFVFAMDLIDDDLKYLRRSFCVLELFSAVEAKQLVEGHTGPMSMTSLFSHSLKAELKRKPVDSATAQTWAAEDKAQIDNFITEHLGFAEFDRVVTQTVLGDSELDPLSLCCGAYTYSGIFMRVCLCGCCWWTAIVHLAGWTESKPGNQHKYGYRTGSLEGCCCKAIDKCI